MPRHPKISNTHDAAFKQLRNLRQAVQLRADQVKLRRLEWDTQTLALPHITPLPGDSALQVRKPLGERDLPTPRAPAKMPEYQPGMPYEIYQTLLELYLSERREEQRSDPYNKLASVTAQAKLEAAQEREDARLEKQREREQKAKTRKAQAKKSEGK